MKWKRGSGNDCHKIFNELGSHIATVHGIQRGRTSRGKSRMSHEYASENARLLATIPELMDVLRGFRRLLIEQGDDLAITTGAPEEFARLDRDYKKALKYIKG